MLKRNDIGKILIIGSGPVIIGQTSEFDCMATQACGRLKELGYRVIMINSDPATLSTDPAIADTCYVEPLSRDLLTFVIREESPDALMPNFGGQPAMTLAHELSGSGVLSENRVQLLGVNEQAMAWEFDPENFRQLIDGTGVLVPDGRAVQTLEDAEATAWQLGYPVMIKPVAVTGGLGNRLVYNVEELREAVDRALSVTPINQVRVETSLMGWQELEVEMARDGNGKKIVLGLVEHLEPAGVHGGDSAWVMPMVTASDKLKQRLITDGFALMDALEMVGTASVRFAHDPDTDRVLLMAFHPRTTRTSMLVSNITGIAIGELAAQLGCGITLDEIPWKGGRSMADFVPGSQPMAVKLARFDFDHFGATEDRLGPQMQATGMVIGLGNTFKESLNKAVRSLNPDGSGLTGMGNVENLSEKTLLAHLEIPSSQQLFWIYEALRAGIPMAVVRDKTQIRPWFIEQIQQLVDLEQSLRQCIGKDIPDQLLLQAKQDGVSDRHLADILGISENEVREKCRSMGGQRGWFQVDSVSRDGQGIMFSSFHGQTPVAVDQGIKVLLLGSGPNRIGQATELDYCCARAAAACQWQDVDAIMVNCNPASVAMAQNMGTRVYGEPLTVEDVLSIYETEKPEGIVFQFAGRAYEQVARQLKTLGCRILGTAPDVVTNTDDPVHFNRVLHQLGIPYPESRIIESNSDVFEVAHQVGYPLMIQAMKNGQVHSREVIHNKAWLERYLAIIGEISPESTLQVTQFLEFAIEAETDALADGKDVYVPAVMEHIELAGVHSGDSAMVIPPVSTPPRHIETIRDYTRRIALELNVVGLLNVQFAIYEDTVYVLSAKLRASRTVPVVSRICNVDLAGLAMAVILGKSLSELDLKEPSFRHFGVKESVFPFNMFPNVDPILGTRMQSTGQVLGLSLSYGRAFFKAQEATATPLPLDGTVLITVSDKDKPSALEPARLFREMGFRILATKGTHGFLTQHGIASEPVKKLGYGRPDVVDVIKSGQVDLVINTPSGQQSHEDDSYIRKAAIQYGVPNITTPAGALASARGIAERKKGAPIIWPLQRYYKEIH